MMNEQQLCSEDSERKKRNENIHANQFSNIKSCDIIKTIYNLLLNASQILMYNTAFIKNT